MCANGSPKLVWTSFSMPLIYESAFIRVCTNIMSYLTRYTLLFKLNNKSKRLFHLKKTTFRSILNEMKWMVPHCWKVDSRMLRLWALESNMPSSSQALPISSYVTLNKSFHFLSLSYFFYKMGNVINMVQGILRIKWSSIHVSHSINGMLLL